MEETAKIVIEGVIKYVPSDTPTSDALVVLDITGCEGLDIQVSIPKKYCTDGILDLNKLEGFSAAVLIEGDSSTQKNIIRGLVGSEDDSIKIKIRNMLK